MDSFFYYEISIYKIQFLCHSIEISVVRFSWERSVLFELEGRSRHSYLQYPVHVVQLYHADSVPADVSHQ